MNECITHRKQHIDSKNHALMLDLNTKQISCELCGENIDLSNNQPSFKE